MSHFSVLVLTREGQGVEELLLPYMENCCGEPPREFMEFFEDEERGVDDETGRRGYWQNPDAKWDWYEVGGRFCGMLRATRGTRAVPERLVGRYPDGRFDSARVGDCDFGPDEEARAAAADFWARAVEGTGDGAPVSFRPPEFYLCRYGDAATFAEAESSFSTWAVVTPDGEWHEQGAMGWWGLSSETDEEALDWVRGFRARFLDTADPDWTATVVDCHI